MTPSEKAQELIDKFKSYTDGYDNENKSLEENLTENARQCALICVEEMLYYLETPSEDYKFFLSVKSELSK